MASARAPSQLLAQRSMQSREKGQCIPQLCFLLSFPVILKSAPPKAINLMIKINLFTQRSWTMQSHRPRWNPVGSGQSASTWK